MGKRRHALINRASGGGTAEVNDLSSVVTWANVPDANIPESSVTQHEAALTILESQITDGALLARLDDAEVVTGDWEFSGPLIFSNNSVITGNNWTFSSAQPEIIWDETDATTDERTVILRQAGGNFRIASASDAAPTVGLDELLLGIRTGTTWSNCLVTADVINLNGRTNVTDALGLSIRDVGATDYLRITHDGTDANISGTNTADVNADSGITAWNFPAVTATSYDGVVAANLLDKTADETVTGEWTFTDDINISSTSPDLKFTDTNAAADHQKIDVSFSNGTFGITLFNDARDTAGTFISTTRSEQTITALSIFATDINLVASTVDVSGALTATSYDGVAAANLLDKSTAETVAGNWTFSGANTFSGVPTFANTMNISNGNGKILEGSNLHSATLNIRANQFNFIELGVVGNASGIEEPVMRSQGGHTEFYIRGTRKFAINESGSVVTVEDGYGFRVQNTLDSDYIQIAHDGTDVNFTHVNTTDWNITGITTIQADTVQANFDAILVDKAAGSGNFPLSVASTVALMEFHETDATVNEGKWDFGASGDAFLFRSRTDADGAGSTIFTCTRAAGLTNNITFSVPVIIGADVTAQHIVSAGATTTQLEDITDNINTDAAKVQGDMVYNTTTDQPVWAVGSLDGDVWVDATGATAHTPV